MEVGGPFLVALPCHRLMETRNPEATQRVSAQREHLEAWAPNLLPSFLLPGPRRLSLRAEPNAEGLVLPERPKGFGGKKERKKGKGSPTFQGFGSGVRFRCTRGRKKSSGVYSEAAAARAGMNRDG